MYNNAQTNFRRRPPIERMFIEKERSNKIESLNKPNESESN